MLQLWEYVKYSLNVTLKGYNFIMSIQHPCSSYLSTQPNRWFAAAIVLCLLILLAPSSFAAPKRVVVLYFEDHSRFDHPTGCGCIPTGPFSPLFGGRTGHKRWHLKEGLRNY